MIRKIHMFLEKNLFLFGVAVLIVTSLGGMAQIIPVVFDPNLNTPSKHLTPYSALELAGRDIYIMEGCALCHSQQVRPILGETQRYGQPARASDSVYDYPFLWGSKRTGPDLANLSGKYSDQWHRLHLENPRIVVPNSIMPAYPWLSDNPVTNSVPDIQNRMEGLKLLGVPYSDSEIENAPLELEGRTEMDAIVSYLQKLGRHHLVEDSNEVYQATTEENTEQAVEEDSQ